MGTYRVSVAARLYMDVRAADGNVAKVTALKPFMAALDGLHVPVEGYDDRSFCVYVEPDSPIRVELG